MSDILTIKRVVARYTEGSLARPKCRYCRHPLHTYKGHCKNCGAPAEPLEEEKPRRVEKDDKDYIKRNSPKTPARFML